MQLARFGEADREDWLLAEARYVLRLANQRLMMAGDTSGAEALLDAPAVRTLQRLDLHRHYISEEMMGRLASLGIPVDLSEQEIEEEWGRYVAVGE